MILICNIEPFKYNQTAIYLAYDNGNILENLGDINLVSLYSFVPSYCHQNNVSTVQLYGNKDYNEMVKKQIKHNEELFFSDFEPITVEVI